MIKDVYILGSFHRELLILSQLLPDCGGPQGKWAFLVFLHIFMRSHFFLYVEIKLYWHQ